MTELRTLYNVAKGSVVIRLEVLITRDACVLITANTAHLSGAVWVLKRVIPRYLATAPAYKKCLNGFSRMPMALVV